MLATDNLLKALNDNDNDTNIYTNRNEDYDLSDVLRSLGNNTTNHKLRFSDGTEGYFSFDD